MEAAYGRFPHPPLVAKDRESGFARMGRSCRQNPDIRHRGDIPGLISRSKWLIAFGPINLAGDGSHSAALRADTSLSLSAFDVALPANSLSPFAVRAVRDVARPYDFSDYDRRSIRLGIY